MEPGIKLFWAPIFSCVYFLRFSGETIESWHDRFFQKLAFSRTVQPDKNGSEGSELLDLNDIFNLECLVKEPIRVTPTSKTLIDTMWSLPVTKVEFLSTSTLEPHISDHRLIYTVMRISLARKRSREVICRSYHESIWYKHDLYETWLLCLFTLHKSLMILMTRPGYSVHSFWKLLTNMPLSRAISHPWWTSSLYIFFFPIWHLNGGELSDIETDYGTNTGT